MSLIDFTHKSCKTKDTVNKQLVENFEEYFAMYSFTVIKDMPNVEVAKDNNGYIVKASKKQCEEIMNTLLPFECSHFDDTLVPVFTIIDEGLRIEFKVKDRESD